MKKHWWKIALGMVALLLLGGVGLIVLLLFSLAKQSREAWAQTEAALEAKGESLSLDTFLPSPIPERENFFADPLWMELADRIPAEKKGLKYHASRLPEKQRKLEVLKKPLTAKQLAELTEEFPKQAALDGNKSHVQIALNIWKSAVGKAPGERQRAAKLVFSLLPESAPIIAQLRRLAERPNALFPLEYADAFHMGLEHLTYLMTAGKWLQVHGLAALETQQISAAQEDALLLLRLSHTLDSEPLLLSKLVQVTLTDQALSVIDQGIKGHCWNEQQLTGFSTALGKIALVPQMARALRLERACTNTAILPLFEKGDGHTICADAGMEEAARVPAYAHWLYGHYFFTNDKAFYNSTLQNWIEALDAFPDRKLTDKEIQRAFETDVSENERATRLMSALALPAIHGGIIKTAFQQTKIEQSKVACALELYRLKLNSYPDSLNSLPLETYRNPDNVISWEDLQYVKNEDDGFLLWTVGWNGTDEGGKVARRPTDGDWVWAGHLR